MRLHRLARGRRIRRAAAITLVAAVVLVGGLATVSPAQAAPRDNLANARLCLRGGWTTLKTSSGASFRSLGRCVVYALVGGQFQPAAPPPPPPPPPPPVEGENTE
jgi:hypothetical protein